MEEDTTPEQNINDNATNSNQNNPNVSDLKVI